MEIRLWGTRGSIPAPGPSTARYGGNTSCVEVRLTDGTLLILDAGSGIRPLGAALGPCTAHLLLSHYHWDHIQGLPFFLPAYAPTSSVRVFGPEHEGVGPGSILAGEMAAPYFPASPVEWQGIAEFGTIQPGDSMTIGTATVRTARLSHPGMTLGFRIEDGDGTFVYISDDEPDVAAPEMLSGILELAHDADLLLHDCQYAEAEYPSHRGWGHSTPRQAVRVASESGARKLLLSHHDPSHPDEQVEAVAEEAYRLGRGLAVQIAREGDTIAVATRLREETAS